MRARVAAWALSDARRAARPSGARPAAMNDGDVDAESRRKDALEHMARIEKEFAELKDR